MRFQNEFQFGNAFLIAPFESTKEYGNIYLPKGQWYNLNTDELMQGGKATVTPLSQETLAGFCKRKQHYPHAVVSANHRRNANRYTYRSYL